MSALKAVMFQDNKNLNDSTITIDENDDDEEKPEPTHYSKIDLRTIKAEALRHELRARGVSCKGKLKLIQTFKIRR